MSTPTKMSEREKELIRLAIRLDLDSTDIEEACKRHDLDYATADLAAIKQAAIDDYGFQPFTLPLHIGA